MDFLGYIHMDVAKHAEGKLLGNMSVVARRGGARRTHTIHIQARDTVRLTLDTEQLIELRDKLDSYIKTRGLE